MRRFFHSISIVLIICTACTYTKDEESSTVDKILDIVKRLPKSEKDIDVNKIAKTNKVLVLELHNDDGKQISVKEFSDDNKSSENFYMDEGINMRRAALVTDPKIVEAKRAQIEAFMRKDKEVTDYFYEEALRISNSKVIINGLRKILRYIEKSEHRQVRKEVFNCFLKIRQYVVTTEKPWRHSQNFLIIDDKYNRFEGHLKRTKSDFQV